MPTYEVYNDGTRVARIRALFEAVEDATGFSRAELIGNRRYQLVVEVRHVAIYLMIELCQDMSLAHIGRVFGRDHTTIMHGRNAVLSEIASARGRRRVILETMRQIVKDRVSMARLAANAASNDNHTRDVITDHPPMIVVATHADDVDDRVDDATVFTPQQSGYIDRFGAIICNP